MPPGQFSQIPPPAAGMLGPTPAPAPGQFPPQLPGFTGTNPAGLTFPGISQQNFPFLPHVSLHIKSVSDIFSFVEFFKWNNPPSNFGAVHFHFMGYQDKNFKLVSLQYRAWCHCA